MIATILISLALLAIVGNIIFRMIRKWRAGQSISCGGSCGGCGSDSVCHPKPPSGQTVHWYPRQKSEP